MRLLDFILRNLQELVGVLACVILIAHLVRGTLSTPRYRIVAQDSASDYLAYLPGIETEEINFWHRLTGFVRTHVVQISSVAVAVAIPVALLAIPSVRVPLTTAGLDFPKPTCAKVENQKLLLFIHGWYGDPEGTWQKFPDLACHDLRLSDVDVIAINYPTFAARRNLDIAGLADWLNVHLDWGRYQRVAVIAHSMGGLVSREIVILRSLGGSQKQIVALVEVASPHLGADPARLASALGLSKPLTQEMAPASSFLTTLRTEWKGIAVQPRTQCYTSPQDNVVPEESAIFQCDGFLAYPQWGHREMVKPPDAADDRYATPIRFLVPFLEPAAPTEARPPLNSSDETKTQGNKGQRKPRRLPTTSSPH